MRASQSPRSSAQCFPIRSSLCGGEERERWRVSRVLSMHAIAFVILRSLILENEKCNETVRVLEHRW